MKKFIYALTGILFLTMNALAAEKKSVIYDCKVEVPAGDDQTYKIKLGSSKAKKNENSPVLQGPAFVSLLDAKTNKFKSLKGAATFSTVANKNVENINVNWSNAAKNPKFKEKQCFLFHEVRGFNISDDKYFKGMGLQLNPKMDLKDCPIPHPPKPVNQKMRCVEVSN
jgi:hypothetical protein